jgi:hypothetical protein
MEAQMIKNTRHFIKNLSVSSEIMGIDKKSMLQTAKTETLFRRIGNDSELVDSWHKKGVFCICTSAICVNVTKCLGKNKVRTNHG